MPSEQNKVIVRRIYDELINQERPSVIDETFAEDVIVHDPFMGVVSGRQAFKQLLGMFDMAFPGHRVEIHALIAEGDWVSVVHTHTALHAGPFMNLAPTGREVLVNGVEVFRLAQGRIAEFWRHDDDAGLMRQLGALPM
ncbi:MAG TPA: ester cyclase [Roseiflexaceae bacterium]|nr:ester cyclase [Roseiflexaceae bacterium]